MSETAEKESVSTPHQRLKVIWHLWNAPRSNATFYTVWLTGGKKTHSCLLRTGRGKETAFLTLWKNKTKIPNSCSRAGQVHRLSCSELMPSQSQWFKSTSKTFNQVAGCPPIGSSDPFDDASLGQRVTDTWIYWRLFTFTNELTENCRVRVLGVVLGTMSVSVLLKLTKRLYYFLTFCFFLLAILVKILP